MKKPDPYMTDDENPEWTDEMFAKARPAREVLGDAVVDALMSRPRGRPKGSTKADRKVSISLRVDPEVLEGYRATGPGWQTRMSEALAAGLKG